MPGLQNQVAPLLRGQTPGWRRRGGEAGGCGKRNGALNSSSLAAHLVAVEAVLTDHLDVLVEDVLGDGGQEVCRG